MLLISAAKDLASNIIHGFGDPSLMINEFLDNLVLNPLTIKLVIDDNGIHSLPNLSLSGMELQQQELRNDVMVAYKNDLSG